MDNELKPASKPCFLPTKLNVATIAGDVPAYFNIHDGGLWYLDRNNLWTFSRASTIAEREALVTLYSSIIVTAASASVPKQDVPLKPLIKEKLDNRTVVLLLFSKDKILKYKDVDYTWQNTAKVLSTLYGCKLNVYDVLRHCIAVLHEVVPDARFEAHRASHLSEMMLAPVKGSFSVHFLPRGDELYTAEQWIQAQIKWILGELRVTRVDWCREQLDEYIYCEEDEYTERGKRIEN